MGAYGPCNQEAASVVVVAGGGSGLLCVHAKETWPNSNKHSRHRTPHGESQRELPLNSARCGQLWLEMKSRPTPYPRGRGEDSTGCGLYQLAGHGFQ